MLRNNSAMATYEVNLACARIHEAIQTSGLHFVINQTPWSSYITVRRKFVHPRPTLDDVNVKDEKVIVNGEVAALSEKNKQLIEKLANLELEKLEEEKEIKATKQKHEKTVQHLNDKLVAMKNNLEEKERDLNEKKGEVPLLEKEKSLKNELIQTINAGFNEKLADANAKLKDLESFKKEVLKNEKKLDKKKRRKLEMEKNKFSIDTVPETFAKCGDVNGNDCEKQKGQSDSFDLSACVLSSPEPSLCTLLLSPARPCPPPARSPSISPLLSPHTPTIPVKNSDQQPCELAPTLSCYFAKSELNVILDLKDPSSSSNPDKPSDYIKKISKLDLRPRQRRNESK